MEKAPETRPDPRVVAALSLALLFWWIIFRWKPLNFWFEMSVASSTLAVCSLVWNRKNVAEIFRWKSPFLPIGIWSALVLYGIFWTGHLVSGWILPFARGQVGTIYETLGGGSPLIVGLLLAAVIGPAEEIFWKGFLQRTLARRLGRWRGWLSAAVIYGALHALSGNFMLTMAALVAGLFWGLVYLRYGSVLPGIISHSLWDVLILLVAPIR